MTLHTKRALSQETEHPLREKPILFSGEMVRAILAGRKAQTRRVVKLPREGWQPEPLASGAWVARKWCGDHLQPHEEPLTCPYGVPGDRLWVKETFTLDGYDVPIYRATDPEWTARTANSGHWKPSIFMPRRASRISLPITSIRVERLQDISATDARAEGVAQGYQDDGTEDSYEGRFRSLWESINGAASWNANPWVWVVGWDKAEVR